jgi:hypothetical protein
VATGAVSLRMMSDFCYLIAFLFSIYCFSNGASSPEWVQPTAERGGFLLCYVCCFVFFCLLACFLRSDLSAILCV